MHACAHTSYIYTGCAYTHILYTHTINKISEGLVWRSRIWPCLPLQSPVPPSPSSSESSHYACQFLPVLQHTPRSLLPGSLCNVFLYALFIYLFVCLRVTTHPSSDFISCSDLRWRVPSSGSLLRPTTPLPLPPPKAGQVPLYSACRDCIPFCVALSLVNHDSLLCVILIFTRPPLCIGSSKRADLCSSFQPQCLKTGLVCRRGSRNTCWLNKWMVRLPSIFIFSSVPPPPFNFATIMWYSYNKRKSFKRKKSFSFPLRLQLFSAEPAVFGTDSSDCYLQRPAYTMGCD